MSSGGICKRVILPKSKLLGCKVTSCHRSATDTACEKCHEFYCWDHSDQCVKCGKRYCGNHDAHMVLSDGDTYCPSCEPEWPECKKCGKRYLVECKCRDRSPSPMRNPSPLRSRSRSPSRNNWIDMPQSERCEGCGEYVCECVNSMSRASSSRSRSRSRSWHGMRQPV